MGEQCNHEINDFGDECIHCGKDSLEVIEDMQERIAELEKDKKKLSANELGLRIRITKLEKALIRIRDLDYRGNRHESSVIAFNVLKEKGNE